MAASRAAYSLDSRANARAAASSPNQTPGGATDVIAVCTPARSISSIDCDGVQSISACCPVWRALISVMKAGDA